MCISGSTYRYPRYGRWICQLVFELAGGPRIFHFLNLGTGEHPSAGKASKYRRAWIIANGGSPRRNERLPKTVFFGKEFLVQVGHTTRRSDGGTHPSADVYSVIREIIERVGP